MASKRPSILSLFYCVTWQMAVFCILCIELHNKMNLSMIHDSIRYGSIPDLFFINNSKEGSCVCGGNVCSIFLFRARPISNANGGVSVVFPL